MHGETVKYLCLCKLVVLILPHKWGECMLRVCEEKCDEDKKIMKGGKQIHNKTHHNTRFLSNNDGVINSE